MVEILEAEIKPEKYILLKDKQGKFIGWKRIVVEYLSSSEDIWRWTPLDYDPDLSVTLSTPPLGIACYKREPIKQAKM